MKSVWWRRGLLFLATLVGSLLVFEEVLPPPGDISGRMVSSEKDLEIRAGSNGAPYAFDSEGFRVGTGEPFDQSVLFVGDSFTLGMHVEGADTFPRAAERAWRREGLRVRGLNAGIIGVGTAAELRLLRRLLQTHPVQAIVLQVLPANDLTDDWLDGGFEFAGGRLVERAPLPPLALRARNAILFSALARWKVPVYIANSLFSLVAYAPAAREEAYELEKALLAEVVATARAHHTPLLIGIFPTNHPVAEDPDGGTRTYERILADARTLGVPVMDLRTVVQTTEDYIPGDGHLSVQGNTKVGEAIARELRSALEPTAAVH